MYDMDRDGWVILVMSFTGRKAMHQLSELANKKLSKGSLIEIEFDKEKFISSQEKELVNFFTFAHTKREYKNEYLPGSAHPLTDKTLCN